MKEKLAKDNRRERGGAGVKMIVVMVVLFLIGHAAINYIPVAYEGASFKEEMQTAVVQAIALPNGGNPVGATQLRMKRAADGSNLPSDTFIEVKQVKSVVQAHVSYTKKVNLLPFGLWVYNYQFDHIATPAGFLLK